ncbi:hypothetical protein H9651_07040 [Microbacterium sp. Sa4CUA7]|uniref:Uncharacterized protein n=1 Tax=Microbacterium pullorum TaxID=2762236 RepID=A0ABR8S2S7_9MICO|nr:hypothetical protein [Microbacterium pullorum]MBD7957389.1 hypothetical protein [Microbacterium pullorum]
MGNISLALTVAAILLFLAIWPAGAFTLLIVKLPLLPIACFISLIGFLCAVSVLESRRESMAAKMATVYGITVDTSVTPHRYSTALSADEVSPDLTQTHAYLAASGA